MYHKHSLPTELKKVPLHDLSHARYFLRELTRAKFTVFVQNPSVHTPRTIFFPSTSKNPKSAIFLVKIFIPNHCKSSGSKFLHSSSIKYQVVYHLNSLDFTDFCAWFVSFGKKVVRELTHAGANLS